MILLRKCVSCGKKFPKFDMIRINRSPKCCENREFKVFNVGDKTHVSGRSCYVCCDAECFKKAKKSSRIDRSFRCKVCSSVYDKIENIVFSSEN